MEIYQSVVVHRYHACKGVVVHIGEVLICEAENNSEYDQCAVVVTNEDGKTVGHVLIELSKVFHTFLADYGTLKMNVSAADIRMDEVKKVLKFQWITSSI